MGASATLSLSHWARGGLTIRGVGNKTHLLIVRGLVGNDPLDPASFAQRADP